MNAITILYKDKDVVVINKPAGIAVHRDDRSGDDTISDWMLLHYPSAENVGEAVGGISRGGIVHRIDKETSGVLILAKHQRAFESLKEQFKKRSVEKVYNAFVYGVPKEKEGKITRPIGRSVKDPRLRSAQRGARGAMREAITHYKVLCEGNDVSFLEARPRTGRTHQIRVHLKALNHQIVCDKLYAPKRPCLLGFTRLALHARSLTLILPNGKEKRFEASLPADFERALEMMSSKNG